MSEPVITDYARGRADGYQAGVLSLSGLERAARRAALEEAAALFQHGSRWHEGCSVEWPEAAAAIRALLDRPAVPDPRDARIAELERERDKLRDAYCEAKEDLDAQGQAVSLAYRRGAEAMREAAARAAMEWNLFLAGEIRALPLPEDGK